MSAKQVKDQGREAPPPDTATNPPLYRGSTQGYDFYLQTICEIQKSIGTMESSVQHLEETTKQHGAKLDEVVKDVHGAKRIAWLFGAIGSALGAVGLVLLNKILDIAVAHYSAPH